MKIFLLFTVFFIFDMNVVKVALSPSKKNCFICFSAFKNYEKCFLFHPKSSLRSQDI